MALTPRDAYLRRTYNITEEQYLLILAHQGGKCAVCREAPEGVLLHVDHDHVTGLVRGLLCNYCNLRIVGRHRVGWKLRAAADYLDLPPARECLGSFFAPTATDRRKAKAKRTRAKARKSTTTSRRK